MAEHTVTRETAQHAYNWNHDKRLNANQQRDMDRYDANMAQLLGRYPDLVKPKTQRRAPRAR